MTTTMTPTHAPSRVRRILERILLGLAGCAALYAIVWAFTILATPVTIDDLHDIPLHTVTVQPGDTWWTIAAACPVDRRVAIAYLAAESGTTADRPLVAGQLVDTCQDIAP